MSNEWQATGPRTPEGKTTSSRNSTTHGCCAKTVILPGESEEEFRALLADWMEEYGPQTRLRQQLLEQVVIAQWTLLRNTNRYQDLEWSLAGKSAADWTEEDHRNMERFLRYRTTAERSFTRALQTLEQISKRGAKPESDDPAPRRGGTQDVTPKAPRVAAEKATGADEPSGTTALLTAKLGTMGKAPLVLGQNQPNKQRKLVILDQWVEVEVEDGVTVTRLYPPNDELIAEGQAMQPPPDLVYRRINFPAVVPPEYAWTTNADETQERGGTGVQRMTVATWLEVIEREQAAGTGHLGPTGVGNLPRPVEHGVCACEVCTHNAAILEARETAELLELQQ